jgi:hypothetical protein
MSDFIEEFIVERLTMILDSLASSNDLSEDDDLRNKILKTNERLRVRIQPSKAQNLITKTERNAKSKKGLISRMKRSISTITLTFGDQAENHVLPKGASKGVGMQKIGEMAPSGFSIKDLQLAKVKFEKKGYVTELICLNDAYNNDADEAFILIVRHGVKALLSNGYSLDDLFNEQSSLDVDKKAFMYGRVVEKHARHNLCFAEESQDPDYENGKGRLVAFNEVPLLSQIRDHLPKFIGKKAEKLMVEGNYYYDIKKCGIGFHGDSERKKVIAVRLGCDLPLHYQWFLKNDSVGERVILMLSHGDLYVMSEKATGYDWKMKNIPTLRHATGAPNFLTIKSKQPK